MTDQPTKRGGIRNPPGGRPPKEASERRVKINITISKALHTQLLAEGGKLSQTIERLLQSAIDTKASE